MKNETHTYTTTRLPTQQPLTHENSPLAQSTVRTRKTKITYGFLYFLIMIHAHTSKYTVRLIQNNILYLLFKPVSSMVSHTLSHTKLGNKGAFHLLEYY